MDLNHIELPASVVADLYHSSLIEDVTAIKKIAVADSKEEEIVASREIVMPSPWKSLGSNHKNILIIVKYNDVVHLPDNELVFLTGILTACKLSLADVTIVNISNHPDTTYKELTGWYKSKIVLLFDIEPSVFGLPMNFPHYQIQPFAGNSFLYAPSLKELENDRAEKTKLWGCLKRLFNL
ncbi:MAG: hypothetical protein H7Y01_09900 [Ferruginibacter sp.]|nr:hypothetical protein [Chitinophagaceae bacterium]